MKNNIALEVKDFSKKYRGRDNYAVRNASFVVNSGEFHGFIGANGAGKTTTIKSLIGAYAKFEGEIKIFGFDYNSTEAKTKIGYIPEKADFPKGMSLYRYLFSMANLSGLTNKKSKEFSNTKIKEFGLEKVRKSSPNTFSSGQKKKVLLAQALVSEPSLLIMDEPTANLDPKARDEFFNELKKLQKQGKTIFMSSHILAEMGTFVDHITILDNGGVVYNGSVKELSGGKVAQYEFELKTAADKKIFASVAKKFKGVEVLKTEKGNIVIIKLSEEELIYNFSKELIKKGVNIKQYKKILLSLQDIYNMFVKKGSVDTPEHLKAGKSA